MAGSFDGELSWFAGLEGLARVDRVDGVPVIHAPIAGPVRGGLMFRVGWADEPLPLRGLSHLVEHLALHGIVVQGDHSNGATGSILTSFATAGSEANVVSFLTRVCAALRDLPMDRVEAERSILRVEAQNRGPGFDADILRVRYGLTGWARGVYAEFGIDSADDERVAAWAREWFVSGNAVAWITTDEVPDALDLRLPEGPRRAFVHPPSLLRQLPAWIEGPPARVLVEGVVPRSSAGRLFAEVLSKSLFRLLRVENSYSYSVGAHYDPLDAQGARILITADSAADSTVEMVELLASTLAGFRDGSFESIDVERARSAVREGLDVSPSAELLAHAAHTFLLDGEPWNPQLWIAESDAVTNAHLREMAVAFWDGAIWQSPSTPTWDGITPIPARKDAPVVGSWYPLAESRSRLVIGTEGVSSVSPSGSVTVLFSDCALALQWPDGGRVLVATNGGLVQIEPTMVPDLGPAAVQAIDAAVPSDAVARLPTRPEEGIPRPAEGQLRTKPRGFGVWALVLGVPAIFAALGVLIFATVSTQLIGVPRVGGVAVSPAQAIIAWLSGFALLAGGAVLIWRAIVRFRWWRENGVST